MRSARKCDHDTTVNKTKWNNVTKMAANKSSADKQNCETKDDVSERDKTFHVTYESQLNNYINFAYLPPLSFFNVLLLFSRFFWILCNCLVLFVGHKCCLFTNFELTLFTGIKILLAFIRVLVSFSLLCAQRPQLQLDSTTIN